MMMISVRSIDRFDQSDLAHQPRSTVKHSKPYPMATGDIKNSFERLRRLLVRLRYRKEVDVDMIIRGRTAPLLPILHYVLSEWSPALSKHFSEKGYNLYNSRDSRFVEGVIKVMRNVFNYRVRLSSKQILADGYAEQKLIFVSDLIDLCMRKNSNLVPPKRRTPPQPRKFQRGPEDVGTEKAIEAARRLNLGSKTGAAPKLYGGNPWVVVEKGGRKKSAQKKPEQKNPDSTVVSTQPTEAGADFLFRQPATSSPRAQEVNTKPLKPEMDNQPEIVTIEAQDDDNDLSFFSDSNGASSKTDTTTGGKHSTNDIKQNLPQHAIMETLAKIVQRLSDIEGQFSRIESKLGNVDARFLVVEGRVKFLESQPIEPPSSVASQHEQLTETGQKVLCKDSTEEPFQEKLPVGNIKATPDQHTFIEHSPTKELHENEFVDRSSQLLSERERDDGVFDPSLSAADIIAQIDTHFQQTEALLMNAEAKQKSISRIEPH